MIKVWFGLRGFQTVGLLVVSVLIGTVAITSSGVATVGGTTVTGETDGEPKRDDRKVDSSSAGGGAVSGKTCADVAEMASGTGIEFELARPKIEPNDMFFAFKREFFFQGKLQTVMKGDVEQNIDMEQLQAIIEALNNLYRAFQDEYVDDPFYGKVGVAARLHLFPFCTATGTKRVYLPELLANRDIPDAIIREIRQFITLLPNHAQFYIVHEKESFDLLFIEWLLGETDGVDLNTRQNRHRPIPR